MVNSASTQQYKISSILARTGQVFFSIQVSYVMGYTQMVLNIAHASNTPTTKLSETLSFNGVYIKSAKTFNIGCKLVNSLCTQPFYGSIRYLTIDDTVVLSATLDALYSTTCVDDTFISCGICQLEPVNNTFECYEIYEATPKIKYLSLDITSTTTASTTISDTSGDSNTFGVSSSAPYRIPLQGYKFEKSKYLSASAGFVLPNSYTVNTWFRINTNTSVPDSQMQYLYLKQNPTGPANMLYIGLTNTYLRIYIAGAIYDYPVAFTSSSNWRYLSVSFFTTSATTTGVQIFLDATKVAQISIPAVYTDSATYNVFVGKDFEGNIYSFDIVPMIYNDLTAPPMLFTGTCTAYGSTSSCTVCPRASTSAGT